MEKYGRYETVKELGEGSVGKVYLAYDSKLNSQVALKVLKKHPGIDEHVLQRFLQEAQITRLVAHPNIVTVFDMGIDHGTNYIVMEFIEGKPLDKIIRESKENLSRLSILEIIKIGIQLAGALDYAHKKGVVHRDIKPSNIILDSEGQVKITDFGIARIKDRELQFTQYGAVLGTPLYMSPEQTPQEKPKPVDERSDLFSLGVVLYELITDQRPFKGTEKNQLYSSIRDDTPDSPHKTDTSIPTCLSDLILKCLEKNPKKRFQTGAEMKSALERCHLEIINENGDNSEGFIKILKRTVLFSGIIVLALGIVYALYYFLTPKALLKVRTTPSGAEVFIDNEKKGETPFEVKLPLGKHGIRLMKYGYYSWEVQLQLDEKGDTLDYSLEPIKGNSS